MRMKAILQTDRRWRLPETHRGPQPLRISSEHLMHIAIWIVAAAALVTAIIGF
jgi:hypothetical protein